MNYSKSTLSEIYEEYKFSLLSGIICGLCAYMYALSNKFVNPDELEYLFTKGATYDSGRWLLALTSVIFPDASMPWINGMIAIALMSVSCCVVIHTFKIKSRILQVLLAGVIVTFPAETLTLTYMFTAAPYALCFLLFTLSVYELTRGGTISVVCCVLLFCFGCAIYQAYLSLAASLFVVYTITKLLKQEWTAKEGFLFCVKAVISMAFGILLYFLINKLALSVTGMEYNEYATKSMSTDITLQTLWNFIKSAYTSFYICFRYRFLQYIPTKTAQFVNFIFFAGVMLQMLMKILKDRSFIRMSLIVLLLALLPIAIFCILLMALIHSLMIYSFVSIYVLAVAVIDGDNSQNTNMMGRDFGTLCLATIVVCNLTYANKIYLKQKLVYEESYGFFSTLATQIKSLPDYSDDDVIALIGEGGGQTYAVPDIETKNLIAVGDELVSAYSRDKILKYYIGLSCEVIDEENLTNEQLKIAETMPRYPADGGIVRDDGVIIVKLDW